VWAPFLALPARHGWTDRDLNQLLTDHHATGHRIPTRPTRPVGFLSWVLTRHGDLDDRPCALDDARQAEEVAAAERRKAAARRDLAQARADRAAAVASQQAGRGRGDALPVAAAAATRGRAQRDRAARERGAALRAAATRARGED